MTELEAGTETYLVRQQKEWGAILTGFEARNKYVATDAEGAELFYAAETGGSTVGRWVLQSMRPFTIHITDTDENLLFQIDRPFKFYFHRLEVRDAQGSHLGSIQRRWSWIRRRFAVLDARGQEVLQLLGPILHPWTFQVRRNGEQIGKITKKWSGLGKEMFTVADNFGVTFPSELEFAQKSLLLGAVFLIDFVYFEKRSD